MLVTTLEQIREVLPVNATTDFDTYKPYVNLAESTFLTKVLGQSLYDKLDGETPDETAVKKARFCIVNYAMFSGFDMLNVTYDEDGFRRAAKDVSLYRYQEENLKDLFKNAAYNGIDDLIEYLQGNISQFEEFKTSQFYLDAKASFFPTTNSFDSIYGINGSRLVFLQISKYFSRVIDFDIIPTIGRPLYNQVVAEMEKETDANADLLALVPYIRKPLAFLAVAAGVTEMGLQITEKGMFFEEQQSNSQSHINTKRVNADAINAIYRQNSGLGQRYISLLFEYLRDNADKYTAFTLKDASVNPFIRNNSGRKTFWA